MSQIIVSLVSTLPHTSFIQSLCSLGLPLIVSQSTDNLECPITIMFTSEVVHFVSTEFYSIASIIKDSYTFSQLCRDLKLYIIIRLSIVRALI